MDNLEYFLHSCRIQAKWHYEQYEKYNSYIAYYDQLKLQRQQFPWHPCQYDVPSYETNDASRDHSVMSQMSASITSSRRKKRKKKKKRKRKSQLSTNAHQVEQECEEEEDEGDVFEINESFRNFLRQSAEFRKQRDTEKKMRELEQEQTDAKMQDENPENVEYVDVMRKGPEGTTLPPTAANRKQLYEEKYGGKGTAILSLETALQWKYNKFIDANSPDPWPALQLRFT